MTDKWLVTTREEKTWKIGVYHRIRVHLRKADGELEGAVAGLPLLDRVAALEPVVDPYSAEETPALADGFLLRLGRAVLSTNKGGFDNCRGSSLENT